MFNLIVDINFTAIFNLAVAIIEAFLTALNHHIARLTHADTLQHKHRGIFIDLAITVVVLSITQLNGTGMRLGIVIITIQSRRHTIAVGVLTGRIKAPCIARLFGRHWHSG